MKKKKHYLIYFNYEHNKFLIILLSISFVLSFRLSFNKIFPYMTMIESIRTNTLIIFIKNLFGNLFFIGYFLEKKFSQTSKDRKIEIKQTETKKDGELIVERKEVRNNYRISVKDVIDKNFHYNLKIISIIIFTYITEEIYFIIDNSHLFDREIIPHRNFFTFVSIFIFNHLLKKSKIYRHQKIAVIINMILSVVSIISFLYYTEIFSLNKYLRYISLFLCLGLEYVLEKYLIERFYMNIYLILGIRSLIGTVAFFIIKFIFKFNTIYMSDICEISFFQKCFYVLFFLTAEYLKLVTLFHFTPFHIYCATQLADLVYSIYYSFERHIIYDLGMVSDFFIYQIIFASISFLLILIFIEVLILNFCDLNINTKKSISERSDKENNLTPIDDDDDESPTSSRYSSVSSVVNK